MLWGAPLMQRRLAIEADDLCPVLYKLSAFAAGPPAGFSVTFQYRSRKIPIGTRDIAGDFSPQL